MLARRNVNNIYKRHLAFLPLKFKKLTYSFEICKIIYVHCLYCMTGDTNGIWFSYYSMKIEYIKH